jgi:hypothetical protein
MPHCPSWERPTCNCIVHGMDNSTPTKKPPAPSVSERTSLTLILRRTYVHARVVGWNPKIPSHDDFCILDGERDVGRIYPELIHGKRKWLWFLQTEPAPPPNRGMADTLEEAKTAFKALPAGQGRVTGDDLLDTPQRRPWKMSFNQYSRSVAPQTLLRAEITS